ncbi:MAG: cytochrome c [Ignavibacteriaceae bacterium]|jgi:mono/diheme cytochrome c family protein
MIENFKKYTDKLSQLKTSPGAVFGLLYPYILLLILAVGIYYLNNINNVERQTVPPDIREVKTGTDLKLQEPRTVPPIDIMKMSKPTSELISNGKTIFNNTCSTCHGEQGNGKGPGAAGLNPSPRNFTQDEGWINGRTISGMYTTLQEGISNSAMVAYDYLTPEQKLSVIHYIRSEFMSNPPEDSESDLEALDQQYNLSEGVRLPGQIPIEYAEEFIIKENDSKIKKIYETISLIKKNSSSGSVKLLTRVTGDLHLAISSLVNSNSWKKNESTFVEFLTINVNQNGFNGILFNLNDSEWDTLYNFLVKII